MTDTAAITFDQLKQWEPGLAALEREIRRAVAPAFREPQRCGNAWWYGFEQGHPAGPDGFKEKLQPLVGWFRTGRTHPDAAVEKVLLSEAAFDAAYDFLFDLMPDCQGCSCL